MHFDEKYIKVKGDDCNDTDPNNWDMCPYCRDNDGDGWFVNCNQYVTIKGPDSHPNDPAHYDCVDSDRDGYYKNCFAELGLLDCNDNNKKIHPGAEEEFDGIDNNCNGQIDEGLFTGLWVTYVKQMEDYSKRIYKMYLEDGIEIELINLYGTTLYIDPRWKPDGTEIVYSTGYIFKINSDGTNNKLLNNKYLCKEPFYSPDGLKIVYVGDSEKNQSGIWIMNSSDGSNQTGIFGDWTAQNPVQFQEKIYFHSYNWNNLGDIYRINLNGTNIERVTKTIISPEVSRDYFSLSPDGNYILTSKIYDGDNAQICVFNLNQSLPLIEEDSLNHFLISFGYRSFRSVPFLSPDNKMIIYEAEISHNCSQIFISNKSGDYSKQITFTESNSSPHWIYIPSK